MDKCGNCGKKANEWHLYNGLCSKCRRKKSGNESTLVQWEKQAFVCMYCEMGYDESYPGQRVCSGCKQMQDEY